MTFFSHCHMSVVRLSVSTVLNSPPPYVTLEGVSHQIQQIQPLPRKLLRKNFARPRGCTPWLRLWFTRWMCVRRAVAYTHPSTARLWQSMKQWMPMRPNSDLHQFVSVTSFVICLLVGLHGASIYIRAPALCTIDQRKVPVRGNSSTTHTHTHTLDNWRIYNALQIPHKYQYTFPTCTHRLQTVSELRNKLNIFTCTFWPHNVMKRVCPFVHLLHSWVTLK